jgi:DNA-binding winged helix-turn-helix (wHTH) protein
MESDPIAMLTSHALAARGDFTVGAATVHPALRTISGPAGDALLEPRVLQVLTVLADAAGEVVTRDILFARCWGSAQVGDDSLNRAVAGARKALVAAGETQAEIETIPRTGYRLVARRAESQAPGAVSRRHLIAAAGGGVLVLGGAGLWSVRSREQRSFDEMMDRARVAMAYEHRSAETANYSRQALALRPDDPGAQALFAYVQAMRVVGERPGSARKALVEAEQASRSALASDPGNPEARLAQITLQWPMLDFFTTEERLHEILKSHPDNIEVMRGLWNLLQCVGRSREAAALNLRAVTLAPTSAMNQFPRAQFLWILGQPAEADRVIDRAMRFWPDHRYVRFARFILYAFTGNPRAALAMLDDPGARPQGFTGDSVALWRVNLAALDGRSQDRVAAAVKANRDAAARSPALASQAILTLPLLGEVDAAFDAAKTLFPGPGRAAAKGSPSRGTAWKFAPFLFTPPAAPLRADPRFVQICDASGLTDYWRRRGVVPDYQRT